jgi:hypothetical protein
MNWNNIKKFCFTWAMPDGAWLEDGQGNRDWFSYSMIVSKLGSLWWDRQYKKHGWMTGCWVEVE